MRSFISQKVDAIVIAPVVVTGWDQVLGEAKKAGIPVFLVDRDVDTADKSLFVTRISADFNLEGRLAGAWLAKALKGKGNIVELQGTPGSAPAIERKKASRPFMLCSRHEDRQVAERQLHDRRRQAGDGGLHQVDRRPEGHLRVYAHNDNMLLGAIQAMKEAGLKPGKDILMVSVDDVPADQGSDHRGRCEHLGRASLRHRAVHLWGGDGVPWRQEGLAGVGRDPLRSAYGRHSRQLTGV